MKKLLIFATSTIILTFASPAFASPDYAYCGQTTGNLMTWDAVRAKVAEKGYDVRRIKQEHGCYEVHAIGQNGARFELYIHPVTGNVVRTKNKY